MASDVDCACSSEKPTLTSNLTMDNRSRLLTAASKSDNTVAAKRRSLTVMPLSLDKTHPSLLFGYFFSIPNRNSFIW